MGLCESVVALPFFAGGWVEEGVGGVVSDELFFLRVEGDGRAEWVRKPGGFPSSHILRMTRFLSRWSFLTSSTV